MNAFFLLSILLMKFPIMVISYFEYLTIIKYWSLQEFVQKHENKLEVICTLSRWLKSNPPSYHIRFITRPKLANTMVFMFMLLFWLGCLLVISVDELRQYKRGDLV